MKPIQFSHGLGDCANAAFLFKLYKDRGEQISIHCKTDKTDIFRAAGCDISPMFDAKHLWPHPGYRSPLGWDNPFADNKTFHNINLSPLPKLEGTPKELWNAMLETEIDYRPYVSEQVWDTVTQTLREYPKPHILLHSRGTTGTQYKSFTSTLETEFYNHFCKNLPGTLFLLDWDNRVVPPDGKRIVHINKEWGHLGLDQLFALMSKVDVMIGVDSGPLHFARFIKHLPTIGCWFGLHPTAFALPANNIAHLVARDHTSLNAYGERTRYTKSIPYRRHAFNLVDVPKVDAPTIGKLVETAISDGVDTFGQYACLMNVIERLKHERGSLQKNVDRNVTAIKVMEHLAGIRNPMVVETGCVRSLDDWGAGYFGYWMGMFLKLHGGSGQLHSVDITPKNVEIAKQITADFPVTTHESCSVQWLRKYQTHPDFNGKPIDLLYLDSMDTDVPQHAEHCLDEAQAGARYVKEDGLILIDDTVIRNGALVGKGRLAVPWLQGYGYKVLHQGYQTLLSR